MFIIAYCTMLGGSYSYLGIWQSCIKFCYYSIDPATLWIAFIITHGGITLLTPLYAFFVTKRIATAHASLVLCLNFPFYCTEMGNVIIDTTTTVDAVWDVALSSACDAPGFFRNICVAFKALAIVRSTPSSHVQIVSFWANLHFDISWDNRIFHLICL